jgi:hypothetical protein
MTCRNSLLLAMNVTERTSTQVKYMRAHLFLYCAPFMAIQRGAKAALQFYPETPEQAVLIASCASAVSQIVPSCFSLPFSVPVCATSFKELCYCCCCCCLCCRCMIWTTLRSSWLLFFLWWCKTYIYNMLGWLHGRPRGRLPEFIESEKVTSKWIPFGLSRLLSLSISLFLHWWQWNLLSLCYRVGNLFIKGVLIDDSSLNLCDCARWWLFYAGTICA